MGLLLIATPPGTHYYVDPAGSDSADGKTAATAWATIAKVNAASLGSKDAVYLKCGSVWREQLLTKTGVTYDSYGSGARPILKASDVLSPWTSESISAGTPAGIVFPGTTAQQVTTPSTTAANLSGANLSIEVDVKLTSYNNGNAQLLIGKDNVGSNAGRDWSVRVDSNQIVIELYNGASTSPFLTFAHPNLNLFLTDGTQYQIRLLIRGNNGSSQSDSRLYTSTDSTTYTLQNTQTSATTFSALNATGSAVTSIGARGDGAQPLTGTVYRARAWSDVTQTTLVIDCNAANATAAPGTFTSGGVTWTIPSGDTLSGGATNVTAYWASWSGGAPVPNQVFDNGTTFLILAASKSALAQGNYWYDGTNSRIYVRLASDANPSGHVVEVSSNSRIHCIYTSGISDTVVRNVACMHAGDYAFLIAMASDTGPDGTGARNVAYNVDISYCAKGGFEVQSGYNNNLLAANCPNNSFYNCTASYIQGTALGGFNRCDFTLVKDCTFHHCNMFSYVSDYQATIRFVSEFVPGNGTTTADVPNNRPLGVVVDGCTIHHSGVDDSYAPLTSSFRGAGVHMDTVGNNSIVRNCTIYGCYGDGIIVEWAGVNTGIAVYKNVIYKITGPNSSGIHLFRRSSNVLIEHNTVYLDGTGTPAWAADITGEYPSETTLYGGMSNNIVRNNIFIGKGTQGVWGVERGAENPGGGIGSGNIYNNNNAGVASSNFLLWGGTSYSTYAAFQTASGLTQNNISGDPLFTNAAAGNFTLQSGSPCKNAASDGLNVGAL